MERDSNDDQSTSKPQFGRICQKCRISIENVVCHECPGPPVTPWEVAQAQLSSMDQLLNGASLLTHTKSNVSNVPESIVRLTPSSDTKTKEFSTDKTKLPLSKVSLRNECLNFDKEAVNVGSSCSKDGSESNIFEIDFDCLTSTRVIMNESSHKVADKQFVLERTPVKEARRLEVPGAPQKNAAKAQESGSGPSTATAARTPRHACPHCSKTFRSNGKLNNHVYTHTGERPFACNHCQKAFSSKFKLVRHLLIHSEERKFLCTVCERRFLRNDHLKNHYKVHDPRKVLFRCERTGCEKEYSSALSQRKHEAWHRAQDGDLTCLLCRVKHETAADLLLHLRRHSGSRMLKSPADRKFRCHVCERHFLTRKDVTRHLVVHTGERDFLCQFCPQRFGRKDHLIRHIKKSHHSSGKKKGKAAKTEDGLAGESEVVAELGEDEDDDDDPEEEEAGAEFEVQSPAISEPDVVIEEEMLLKNEPMPSSPDLDDIDTGEAGDKVPTDLEEIQTSELIMRDPSPEPLSAVILTQEEAIPTLSSDMMMSSQPAMDIFFQPSDVNFDSVTTCGMLSAADDPVGSKKEGDLFEGTSQSLMYAEPTFEDDEFKSTDFLLGQGSTSGELLRFLLQSDPTAPLPGFSQAFNNNPGPPNS